MTGTQRRMIYDLRHLTEIHWSYAQLAGLFHCNQKTIREIVEKQQWDDSNRGKEQRRKHLSNPRTLVWRSDK